VGKDPTDSRLRDMAEFCLICPKTSHHHSRLAAEMNSALRVISVIRESLALSENRHSRPPVASASIAAAIYLYL
jgi:hypothetical protein